MFVKMSLSGSLCRSVSVLQRITASSVRRLCLKVDDFPYMSRVVVVGKVTDHPFVREDADGNVQLKSLNLNVQRKKYVPKKVPISEYDTIDHEAETPEEPSFVNQWFWVKLLDPKHLELDIKKGCEVLVHGQGEVVSYLSKDGVRKQSFQISADALRVLKDGEEVIDEQSPF